MHPTFNGRYKNFGIPAIRTGETDALHIKPAWGTPIYKHQSRMGAARRFFDDEELRAACIDHVKTQGEKAFFDRPTWRDELLNLARTYRETHTLHECFESEAEQAQAILHSLQRSRQIIEERLAGHTVRHLCFPWHRYGLLAAALARDAGYVTLFTDINPQKPAPDPNNVYTVQRSLPLNEYGDDPYQITRIDGRDNLLLSLPGRGRIRYRDRFLSKFARPPRILQRFLR